MLDFAKRVLAAAWARFAPNAAVDLKGFGSARRILAAVWAGFAPSGLVEVRGWIQPGRVLSCSLGRFCAEQILGTCNV